MFCFGASCDHGAAAVHGAAQQNTSILTSHFIPSYSAFKICCPKIRKYSANKERIWDCSHAQFSLFEDFFQMCVGNIALNEIYCNKGHNIASVSLPSFLCFKNTRLFFSSDLWSSISQTLFFSAVFLLAACPPFLKQSLSPWWNKRISRRKNTKHVVSPIVLLRFQFTS